MDPVDTEGGWLFPVALCLLIGSVLLQLSETGNRDHGLPTFTMPVSVGLVALLFLMGRDNSRASRQLVRFGAVVVAYLASLLISTIFAGDVGRSTRMVVVTLRDFAMAAALVVLITSVRRLHLAVWAVIVAGGFMGLLGWLQHNSGTLDASYGGLMGAVQPAVIGGADRFELAGPELSPNFFGRVLAVVALLACERALHCRRVRARLFAAALTVCCVASLFFTYSRGALLSLGVGFLVLVVGAGRRQRVVLVGGLAVGAAFLVLTQAPLVTHLLNSTPGSSQTSVSAQADPSIAGRTSEYQVAIDMFVDHPLFGVGRKNFDRLYQSYAIRYGLDDRAGERGVPNMYLEALAELGIVGLAAFVAIPVSMLVLLRRARRRFDGDGDHDSGFLVWGVVAAVTAFLVDGLFEGGRSIYLFWILCAFAVAADGVSAASARPRNNPSASTTLALSNSATGTT